MVTHIAWDKSIIGQAIADSTGQPLYAGQKETRTVCKRKVSVTRIDNTCPTCPDCASVIDQDHTTSPDALVGFGKYFFYKPSHLHFMPTDFQETIRPYIDLLALEVAA